MNLPPLCHICRGRGEVEAGITTGFVCTGHVLDDADGLLKELGHPTVVLPSTKAVDKNGEIWFTRINPLVPLWSLAICIACHGTGMDLAKSQVKS